VTTLLGSDPVATAMALIVMLEATPIGLLYTGELVVGVDPSVV
jgi:hypothetical protein